MNDKKQHYLSMHKYKIFQDKDGRWKTTLPDETKKNGRRLIARKQLESLNNTIIQFYESEERKEKQSNLRFSEDMTLEELYPVWLESRMLEVKNIRTVKRNDQEWKRYYQDTDITKIPMRQLTVNQLKDWAHRMIDDYNFNKRDYYNMTLIIKKCYEYASDEGLCEDIWSKAKTKVNTKKLKRMTKKENDSQIYFFDEKVKLVQHALKMFTLRPWNIGVLAIPFLFLTGLRIGEVVALKYEDLTDSEIVIRRSETSDFNYDKEDGFKYAGKIIEDHTKTEAGERRIPYTKGAKQIINLIERSSQYYNYCDNGYIFCPASKRLISNSIDNLLYNYCEAIGIPKKSAHKIRKTYISQIINSGIDLDTVCRISGHVDLKTTLQSYYYALERKEEVYDKFNEIFENIV